MQLTLPFIAFYFKNVLPVTYVLVSWSRVKKFPAFYGTRRYITAFKIALHLSLSWSRSIQPMPAHPISWRSILIISSYLRLDLPSGLFFFQVSPRKFLYATLLSPIRAACPARLTNLDFNNRIISCKAYMSLSFLFCSLDQASVTSTLFGPNILFSTFLSHTLSQNVCITYNILSCPGIVQLV